LHRGRRHDLSARRELRRATTLDIDAADAFVEEPVRGAA
jgi:alpha-ketoglutarate-dependent 2,4-dichlorophenoxyacetate dioxygenase